MDLKKDCTTMYLCAAATEAIGQLHFLNQDCAL